ncbi:MAG: VOC family protein [Rhodothermales bacterium]|nr:VOC family protein [Rhodothermales bacterium]
MQIPEIDHLVFVSSDLEAGMDHIERLLGVRPAPGGRHPDFGTHNALLGLGPGRYLEVLAPDPSLDPPPRGRLTDVWGARSTGLFTWVARSEDIDTLAAGCPSPLGSIDPCTRLKPDGTWLSWRLSDPFVGRLGGPIPFLIDWGDSPHPADTAPPAGTLTRLSVHHPESERIERILESLSIAVPVTRATQPGVRAEIRTVDGRVVMLE